MKRLSRRSFLTASAALAAEPALSQTPSGKKKAAPKDTRSEPRPPPRPITSAGNDVVIIGAGAAGIAAARRLAATRLRVIVVEAADQIGGRCITDTTTFGLPFDRGAHWIHMPEINPVARLATQTGLDIYPAPTGQRVRVGRRFARDSEMEQYLAGVVRTQTAITDTARGRVDVACGTVVPKDLGDWRSAIEFFLGPFGCSKDLADISALDFSRSAERDIDAFCRQGFGTLLARLGANIPVQLSLPVTRVTYSGRQNLEVETSSGRIEARTAVITVSTNALTSGQIKFAPDLPGRYLSAADQLKLGSYDHIALEIPNNPFGLRPDELMIEKAAGPRTAALLGNTTGSTLCLVEVGGRFGRELSAKGEPEMVAFAIDWLTNLYGSDIKNAIRRRHATRWNAEPYVRGAFSAAAPGTQPSRKVLMEPVANRIWFAGEAVHETLWGTVGGAWESGERAADGVMRALGVRRG